MKVLVAGAGGFIGGHLVRRLIREGHTVRAVDIKPLADWWQIHDEAENRSESDLSLWFTCLASARDQDHIYNLAADMGGMGFIENNRADCMLSVLINTHLLKAAVAHDVKRFFYASSACVYHAARQKLHDVVALKEEDAYYNGGAMPEDGYGWEKLFSERMCRHFMEDKGIECRVARFHNVYGPHGSWTGGREKAPAAMCRKVAEAKKYRRDNVDVWGDGKQTRSFMYVDDCVEGVRRLMDSDVRVPLNVGSSQMVSIDKLRELVETVAGTRLIPRYLLGKPKGVAGRNSDNTLIKELLNWEPQWPLITGLKLTYEWIEQQVKEIHHPES